MGCHLLQSVTLCVPHWTPTCGEMVALGSRLLLSLKVRTGGGWVNRPTLGPVGGQRRQQAVVCSVHHASSDSALSTPSSPGAPPWS